MTKTPELQSLAGQVCPACGAHKGRGRSLCRDCYDALPIATRQTLYQAFGQGYEEAVANAIHWLREQKKEKTQAAGVA